MPEIESVLWLGKAKSKPIRLNQLDSSEWIGKEEAGRLLNVSTRQLQRRAQEGFIARRYLPKSETQKTAPVVYSRADIEQLLREGIPAKYHMPGEDEIGIAKAPAPQTSLAARPPAPNGGGELAHLMNYFAAAFPPAPRPWLALAEAAEYSGLPAAYLVAQARSGAIRAVNVGTGAREFWRFNREGLGK